MSADARMPRGWVPRVYARLRRALDPGAERDRDDLRDLVASLRKWRKTDEARANREADRGQAIERSLETMQRDLASHRRDVTRLRQLFTKQRDLSAQIVRRAALDQRAVEAEQRVIQRLTRVSKSGLPLIVGPWTGEVGFELLYWIPFLQWAGDTFPLDADRVIVVSRGGVGGWYRHVSRQYEDVFRHATPQEFRGATEERKKQHQIRTFDRQVIKRVLRARGIRRAHLLHPTLMYELYNAFWRYDATIKRLDAYARFRTLDETGGGSVPPLPREFVAVRFYFSDCFPDSLENRAFAGRIVDGLAARTDVVLLNNDLVVDDHRDFSPAHRNRVHLLAAGMQPETNLAVQTEVIRRARAFVGTYGGYSYLAPLCGVSSVAFYSRVTFKQHHLEVAQRVFSRLGSARLIPLDVRRAELLGEALGGLVGAPAGS